jgi:anti-sigma regulatory factor (Ser/Thr protein kinase)
MTGREGHQTRAADHITFAALLTAVGCARLFVKYTLQNWRIERQEIETMELLVSELTTNAVKSTGVIEPNPAYGSLEHLALVHVRLLLLERSTVLEVWDNNPNPPIMQQTLDAEDGRGLFLDESMSRHWNYYHPKAGGKVVWCEIDLPQWPIEDATTELPRILPRRKRRPGPTKPIE